MQGIGNSRTVVLAGVCFFVVGFASEIAGQSVDKERVEKSAAACENLKIVSSEQRQKIISFLDAPDQDKKLNDDPTVQKAINEVCPKVAECLVPRESKELERIRVACRSFMSK